MVECNADVDHPCDANDGEPCADCEAHSAEMWAEVCAAPECVRRLETKTAEEFAEELRDAGRGNLVAQ